MVTREAAINVDDSSRAELLDVATISEATGLSLDSLSRLCSSNYVLSLPDNGELKILSTEIEKLRDLADSPRLLRAAMTLGESFMYRYHPELHDYLYFHDTLDVFCWLLKLRYSDKSVIRRRNYRLDRLLVDFIKMVPIDLVKISRLKGESFSAELMSFHLTKGWYNELVRSHPITQGIISIGPRIHQESPSCDSAAWNIIQSYYAIYEFANTLVFTNTDTLRTDEHTADFMKLEPVVGSRSVRTSRRSRRG